MLRITRTSIIALLATFFFWSNSQANNIKVENTKIVNQDVTNQNTHIRFDVSWENSWKTSNRESNYDAAYVFVKYRVSTMNTWKHASLAASGHSAPSGGVVDVTDDGKAAFIYRDADGIGDVSYEDIILSWDYGLDGLRDDDSVEVCVLAIEMVYVPEGAYYLGDGAESTPVGWDAQFELGQTGKPFEVTSEDPITLGGAGVNSLNAANNARSTIQPQYRDDFSYTASKSLPEEFPKGYQAFYMMKYEITQGMYADFLNKLTAPQAAARYMGNYNSSGIAQTINGTYPAFAADVPDKPLEYMNYMDILAYLDWTALRPMTELEYEKASRGTISLSQILPDSYAWGDVSLTSTHYTLTNASQSNEIVNNPGVGMGNANCSSTTTSPSSSFRVGIFAASTSGAPTRAEAGASYYGIMELSGNIYEMTIPVGSSQGRAFEGVNGDGELTNDGKMNVASWPADYLGIGFRGGSYSRAAKEMRTSSRIYANYFVNTIYDGRTAVMAQLGGRGVRTAD